ncbi:Stk1 family PASTA domain-containing Ser/Thr kinase [Paenibacillus sp. PAMC21692]|uniref:Stk1 family PASTA domain-containing Ser/Thr kinase n=1 Tax=Paenibacillus sp. PAMC21692 TaxID=2762320 RepID=UPI00164DCAFE|nr:Stk1 family PASTA domain-containing Ser/Thr kinase [Paenibacillus sp. PAMC21692]QNK54651.1 Stk1 family PASTA domain-containing Ser/Thr kinase [Paenibacillus sp. PAMC21692]
MIGHDLAGRYEIITRVGGGGMALVYKAHDVLLNRYVAVKVLRQQFVGDEEFIRRFRREAQSAAALSHPNVVSIYDVGQEDDIHYIVMEYIEGSNLNEIIQERAPLQTDEAVRIAMQICDALDHAHQNHIIHRDIKPHNILIGNNGRVKVTDFGIARAVTSSTITQTGSVIGSVHYFSPEHAKGINTGEKSDLYSLGIVLYQMLTAKLPFFGESPISVALKHLQEPFEEPRVVNPHIPQSVENVILKSMRKNPAERYSSAHEMFLDLDTCLRPDRLNEPRAEFTVNHDLEETRVMPAIRGSVAAASSDTAVRSESKATVSDTTSVNWQEEEKRPKGWKKPLLVVGITLLLLALLLLGFRWVLGQLDPGEAEVPYVIGKTELEARAMIAEKGLRVKEPPLREFNKDVPKDVVIEQSKKNISVKKNSFIELTISDGPELKTLKSYVGQKLQAAKDELIALGITEDRIKVTEEHSEEEAGTILEQTPDEGAELNPETAEVSFVVSMGRETVLMEDLADMRLKDARSWLKSKELVFEESDTIYEASYLHEKDHVIKVENYNPGDQVPKGTKIVLRVSSGPPADSKTYQFNVRISPAQSGKSSEVKIMYSDATGENIEGVKRTINSTVDIPVTVILSPDTVARVTVMRDNQFMDTVEIHYDEIGTGNDSPNLNIPGSEATEPPQPEAPGDDQEVQAEVDNSNGENGTEGEENAGGQ